MKKLFVYIIISIACLAIGAQQSKQSDKSKEKPKERVLNITKSYVYQEASMLISERDLYCSYFVKDKVPDGVKIIADSKSNISKTCYTDNDLLIINRGVQDNIKEGDRFFVMSSVKRLKDPFSKKWLGTLYFHKAQAEVTCVYENSAIVLVNKSCAPVLINDFLIPFKAESTLFEKRINYTLCTIPRDTATGRVIYIGVFQDITLSQVAEDAYLTINLGKDKAPKGTYLLLYKKYGSAMPPIIIGSAIVIHAEDNNVTVKVLEASNSIEADDYACVIPYAREAKDDKLNVKSANKNAMTAPQTTDKTSEKLPIVEQLKADEVKKEEAQNYEIFFSFDSSAFDPQFNKDLETIKSFVASKAQYVIILRGYCCGIGMEEHNLKLAQARVETIKALLTGKMGIDPQKIESYYYGEKENAYDNTVEAERKKNRRVKIEVIAR